MTDNAKKLAQADLERSIAEVKRFAEKRGIDFSFGDMRAFENMKAGSSIADGEDTLVTLLVGARGSLTRAAAKDAARVYGKIARGFPKAVIAVVMAGYDTDEREIPAIPEAAEHFRRFARLAGLASVHDALASPLHRDSVGLLAACGSFHDYRPADVRIVRPPSTARH